MTDDKPRSRSRSPNRPSMRDAPTGPSQRNRSRSPRRERRGGGGGFRWKEKRRDDDRDREGGDRRLERGYRNRSPRRERRDDRDEGRDGGRDDRRGGDRREGQKDRARREKRERIVEAADSKGEDSLDLASKFGTASTSNSVSAPSTSKPAPAPQQQQSAAPTERMITVFVNDRLGTRAQIPCLASDNIKLFKMQVAAQIGRQPHEILLKRQGERPFKDMLTLEDYGVSNGVQIDLEIDTGE